MAERSGRTEGSEQAATARVVCGDLDIRIARDGTWYYHGSPIGRKEMVRLFASVLRRYPDGSYWLVTPAEAGRIVVEDAPFVGVAAEIEGAGRDAIVRVRTNVDEEVVLDAEHRLLMVGTHGDDPIPYVELRDGLTARLSRSVYYELVACAVEEKVGGIPQYGLWSRRTFFPLGTAEAS